MEKIKEIVQKFVVAMTAAIQQQVNANILARFPGASSSKASSKAVKGAPSAKRRKGPIQLCPAPGCKNRAAPVFGMLCGDHKGAPKKTVAKWREARRAKASKKK